MDWPASLADGANGILSTTGAGSMVAEALQNAAQYANNSSNLGSNVVQYIPIVVPKAVTVYEAMWNNGGTVSGNIDAGLMDAQGHRLVNTGPVLQSGVSSLQVAALTPTLIQAGIVYAAFSQDNTSGTVYRMGTGNFAILEACGVAQQTTGTFGIPATWTLATISNGVTPFVAFAVESAS